MDAGVTAAVKVGYRAFGTDCAVNLIHGLKAGCNVCKGDVLTAVRALKKVWEEYPSIIISSWLRHTKLRPTYVNSDSHRSISNFSEMMRSTLQQQISSEVSVHARVAIELFIRFPGEKDCVEDFNEKEALPGPD